ncbi:PHD finger protein ALFIN-LIKE 2 [Platanthera guangdongensis]|uniref:PHD finger protein ALFIN-LIKE n=1 Tax=Platanthera guangdongensis TaxID=2320717 RepID=A0ABR2LUP5_9ASPA
MEMPSISSTPRTVEEIFKDFCGRRTGIINALNQEVVEFYALCDPGLIGFDLCREGELVLVRTPEQYVGSDAAGGRSAPELPEPALGINFARDGMNRRDWLSLVAVHSDSWLLSVAFYLGARFNGNESLISNVNIILDADYITYFSTFHNTTTFNVIDCNTPT